MDNLNTDEIKAILGRDIDLEYLFEDEESELECLERYLKDIERLDG
jgi:hypothetical protein